MMVWEKPLIHQTKVSPCCKGWVLKRARELDLESQVGNKYCLHQATAKGYLRQVIVFSPISLFCPISDYVRKR